MRTLVLPVLAAAFALSGCGSDDSDRPGGATAPGPIAPSSLFASDFVVVCDGGSITTTKAYDPAGPGHKAVYLESYYDQPLLNDASSKLPEEWQVKVTPDGKAHLNVDVVICAKRTAQTFAQDCDDYQVGGKPSDLVVKVHTATYQVRVLESKTGKQLAATEVQASEDGCPSDLFSIPAGTTSLNYYASLTKAQVLDVAKPFVQP